MRRLMKTAWRPTVLTVGLVCGLAAVGCGGDSGSGGIEKPAKYEDAPKGLKISGAGGGGKARESRGTPQTPE